MLELALLGILHDGPMHGYELRKQLSVKLGALRAAFSYGSLYPTLRRLKEDGWITDAPPTASEVAVAPPLTSKRGKVVYRITAEGKERFTELLSELGPGSFDDTAFGVHFAFFGYTDPQVRLRILEGRRRKVEEKREGLIDTLHKTSERLDAYTLELQRYGLDAANREVRWLNELIATEQASQSGASQAAGKNNSANRGEHEEEA